MSVDINWFGDEVNCDIRPDAQGFDEVRIVTIPRYKESELSGDEWRIHAEVQFYRKGKLIHSCGHGTIEHACGFAYADYILAIDNGNGYFAGDGIHCDQEGCSESATVRYKKKFNYDRSGNKSEPHKSVYRHFCPRHEVRGDCGLDDADANYEKVSSREGQAYGETPRPLPPD